MIVIVNDVDSISRYRAESRDSIFLIVAGALLIRPLSPLFLFLDGMRKRVHLIANLEVFIVCLKARDELAHQPRAPEKLWRDLDDTTTKEDVFAAIKKVAGEKHHISRDTIMSMRNSCRGTKIALVTLAIPTAKTILGEHGEIKIGWVNRCIKAIMSTTGGFKCWYYGHRSIFCKSKVDRTKYCIKCGNEGHSIDKCEESKMCSVR
ncbi:hypothetical protein EVAR_36546_1 [Eumeta japonica]|uniref:CCHC-type domain-containing protein n=1 Tax=Eumeta variegata TaxID=151549 RepID=A0A4C1Z7P1_EUMVA|nr:hypothetical protein EVAR_36546_1 [Eumeta japonica]